MLKWKVVLPKTEIHGYSPVTASSKKIERKKELYEKLKAKLGTKLPELQNLSLDKPLCIEVCYYLFESDKDGQSKKDLDNLLKILFDVLSENMNNGQDLKELGLMKDDASENTDNDKALKGLGLMKDDTFVYKIKCEKKKCSRDEQGLDLKILAMRRNFE